ncbi:hypothetical protein EDD65_10233 [Keratinibaculum paraultunense]|uniref:Uncharacterized protein n=1 Tax=Keratinibaculum paraultunense TaxID=1278232 RepID=A0A4R3L0H1_9FIRM|nr:hypothetical protein [Keratinibaculum paraultunense]QQY80394.1 hypothetical protein JL105_03550 [Keratinibaculum paraultunense]TCS91107.1 hypothetical protein EDD65_10233 [Keratinibaculum paraultunense]
MFYNDKIVIIKDIESKIIMFRLINQNIIKYTFYNTGNLDEESIVGEKVHMDFDVSIDKENTIFVLYQDMSFNLILTVLKEDQIENIKLTKEAIPETYNLNIIVKDDSMHIFYCISLTKNSNIYRIYHHYYNGNCWNTNIVDEINSGAVLNPFKIVECDKGLIIAYHDKQENNNVYLNFFNIINKKWGKKLKIVDSNQGLLYLDMLLKDNKLHIVYCQYDENLVVKYERFIINDKIIKDISEILSNEEGIMYPTLVYYEDKLWAVWLEYENIMSRYSKDNGTTWSPIYLWEDSRQKKIVRYKYIDKSSYNEDILNYSFGSIKPHVEFIGFGNIEDAIEVPLKKKISSSDILNSCKEIKKEIQEIYDRLDLLEKNIDISLQQDGVKELRLLKDKVNQIEEFLIRRTRGFYLKDINR